MKALTDRLNAVIEYLRGQADDQLDRQADFDDLEARVAALEARIETLEACA